MIMMEKLDQTFYYHYYIIYLFIYLHMQIMTIREGPGEMEFK
jgi:hypothetical protein